MSEDQPEPDDNPWLRSFLREIRASGWLFQPAKAQCESHSISENVRLRILAEVERQRREEEESQRWIEART